MLYRVHLTISGIRTHIFIVKQYVYTFKRNTCVLGVKHFFLYAHSTVQESIQQIYSYVCSKFTENHPYMGTILFAEDIRRLQHIYHKHAPTSSSCRKKVSTREQQICHKNVDIKLSDRDTFLE
jgi:hypothetical protein